MGVVYEARDRGRGMRVALKMLASDEPSLLYRLKREFRSLADLRHPNLVSMYELISEKEIWFYTMELIQGVDLMTHVRRSPSAPGGLVDTAATSGLFDVDRVSERLTVEYVRGQAAPRGDFDPERLRNVLGQLVLALRFLHDHGKIHRDIKPSNVLVTPEGRAVLLDFGIVIEVTDHGKMGQSTGAYIVGTSDYMAPEQAEGEQVSEKADWYALGVLLFEALTGGVPFSGNLLQVLLQKQTEEPPSLERFKGTPEADLAELCADLLKADPEERPAGEEIAERLGISAITVLSATAHQGPRESQSGVFVGRERELATLHTVYEATCRGTGGGILLCGSSGIGKTGLVQRFLAEVQQQGEASERHAAVFQGRCYGRETVPYKAFDNIIDALSHTLVTMREDERRQLLPDDFAVLARLFPVLQRIRGRGKLFLGAPDVQNPQELRAKGFSALKQLLMTLASMRPLILVIDDLQWIDRDSVELFDDLLRPPFAPPIFLVGCARATEIPPDSLLARIARILEEHGGGPPLVLGPLSSEETNKLARHLLEKKAGTTAARSRATAWADSSIS